ncbi:hypothetical protein JDV02_009583 [Purpureocillium takamizusanense]|uniref:Peptide hydrolase n=1 Tax=Purpureocillium takamizusanense TaxID=2060973 RepID=A0A9Q8QQ15_9HYPO|nr:uncharacterized protein JDV02_009583 [Purpureocillium takamizusanense]UNI23785.1 hypothetical protein JDV02_009583 [Purpureocillium takamizusanense]
MLVQAVYVVAAHVACLSRATTTAQDKVKNKWTLEKPEQMLDMKFREAKTTVRMLSKAAVAHGGNRAFGTAGFNASMQAVLGQLEQYSKSVKVHIQQFSHLFEETRQIKFNTADVSDDTLVSLRYNTATPPEGIYARLIDASLNDTSRTFCSQRQWDRTKINATDKIVLMERGGCPLAKKLRLATENGARAVIFYHNTFQQIPTEDAVTSEEHIGKMVPAGITTRENGHRLSNAFKERRLVRVNFTVDAVVEKRNSWNVIAQTKEGNPRKVIMVGANLDSFPGSEGLNDNASGAGVVMQVLDCFAHHRNFTNAMRFAWWGAGKKGSAGSRHYLSELSDWEARNIAFYFNYERLASQTPNYTVHGNNEADINGAKELIKHLRSQEISPQFTTLTAESDYTGFTKRGIPCSGISGGPPGNPDELHVLREDSLRRCDWKKLRTAAKSAVYVAAKLALTTDEIPRPEDYE